MHTTDGAAVFQESGFRGCPAVIIGTGPSLNIGSVKQAQRRGAKLFGINNTFSDFDLNCWIACDPSWHERYSPVSINCDKWHWDRGTCERFGYMYIPGKWGDGPNRCDGLSLDKSYIAFGHSSGFQALNLAVHYGCDPILLAGYDMHYRGDTRHYFTGLSDCAGEYPERLRKYSAFDGLVTCYEQVAKQDGLPRIINCTPGSALTCFEMGDLDDPGLYR